MRRIILAVVVGLVLWGVLVAIVKVDNINAEYERNIHEHPPGAPPPVMH